MCRYASQATQKQWGKNEKKAWTIIITKKNPIRKKCMNVLSDGGSNSGPLAREAATKLSYAGLQTQEKNTTLNVCT